MDPLSVIASITGILTAAVKISSAASSVISRWKEAPISLYGIVEEMSTLEACVTQLKPYVQGIETSPKMGAAAITVDHVVVVTSSCVLAISELQKTLETLSPPGSSLTGARLRWISQGKKIDTLRSRVQASTSSLNLILNVLNCSIGEESRQTIAKLEQMLDQILRSDTDLFTRLSNPGSQAGLSRYPTSESQSQSSMSDDASMVTIKGLAPSEGAAAEVASTPAFGLDSEVERGLFSSIVYLRAYLLHSSSSLPSMSGAGSKCGWSVFSDFGLTQISDLSVISLPISYQELWNPEQYRLSNQIDTPNHGISMKTTSVHSVKFSERASRYFSPYPKFGSRDIKHLISNKLLTNRATARRFISRERKFRASVDGKVKLGKALQGSRTNVLLLGAGEAGKSTLVKQFHLACAGDFSASERFEYVDIVRKNLSVEFPRDIDRIRSPEYRPTNDDILRTYVKTLGIAKTSFGPDYSPGYILGDRTVRVFDVGGARCERRKWVHAFQNASVVLFIAPLTGYDEGLYEEETAIQLQEAVAVFEDILSLPQYSQLSSAPLFLVLSKFDLLDEKLKTNSIKQYWPDYNGPSDDPYSVTQYFVSLFRNLSKAAGRELVVYVVNLTATDDTRQMLNAFAEKLQHPHRDDDEYFSLPYTVAEKSQNETKPMSMTTFEEELQHPHGDDDENSSLPDEIAGKNQNVLTGRLIEREYQRGIIGSYYNKKVGSGLFKVKGEEIKRVEYWQPTGAMF